MRYHFRAPCLLVVVLLCCVACRGAAPRSGSPGPSSASVPAAVHDSLTIRSNVIGEARLVNVHVPVAYRDESTAATRRFPVLYMPDGGMDEDFPHIARAVDSLTAAGVIRPVILVGVPNTERRRDLTGPTRVASDSAIAKHVGGSEAFRRFIKQELIPTIDARYRTTQERAIIGESLAGLFIVETFLRDPLLFDHYVAFDPSLWWNRGALLDSAATMMRAAPKSANHRSLYVAASSDDIGKQSARLLRVLGTDAPAGLWWTIDARADLTHATIFQALESRGLVNALR